MTVWIFASQQQRDEQLALLKCSPCPHCKHSGALNRHGYLKGYSVGEKQHGFVYENARRYRESTYASSADALAESRRIAAIRKLRGTRHGEIEMRAIGEGWDATRTELEVVRALRASLPNYFSLGVPIADGQVLQVRTLVRWLSQWG